MKRLQPLLSVLVLPWLATTAALAGDWQFTDITVSSGIQIDYTYDPLLKPIEPRWICGGAAAGDIDNDGFTDLFLVGGELGSDALYRNKGDGTFEEISSTAGAGATDRLGCGPLFVDIEGDGDDDLLVWSVWGAPEFVGQPAVDEPGSYPLIYRNQGTGTFQEVSSLVGFQSPHPAYSASFADIDQDGDLDGFVTHWRYASDSLLWRNDGGSFTDVSTSFFGADPGQRFIYSFTPNFTDLNGDRRPDLVVAGDFGNSRTLLNSNGTSFVDVTNATISDDNGMGATVGDIDNDGDFDWFVSSIWDPDGMPGGGNWGISGNRMYSNRGNGIFDDVTDIAGVRLGYWGWGSCFADFDNDQDLDLFHVNGFPAAGATEFHQDPARLFLNDGTGVFTESSVGLGLDDPGQGRGVVCFDLERDGDIDILIAQNGEPSTLYRNDLPAGAHYLTIALDGESPNPRGIGARVELQTTGLTQVREIRAGSNFVSQNPSEAHFGMAGHTHAELLQVAWPDGRDTKIGGVAADQRLRVSISTVFADGFEHGSTAAWSLVGLN